MSVDSFSDMIFNLAINICLMDVRLGIHKKKILITEDRYINENISALFHLNPTHVKTFFFLNIIKFIRLYEIYFLVQNRHI